MEEIPFMPKGIKGFQKGHSVPIEIRNKFGLKLKGRHVSPKTEFKKGIVVWNKGLKKELQPNYGKHRNEETKRKIGEKNKFNTIRQWKNPIYRTKMINILKNIKRKPHSEETKEKIRLSKLKDKHWNWQGGKSFEVYSIHFDKSFRKAILKRDNNKCLLCGKTKKGNYNRTLSIHHIDFNKKNTSFLNCCSTCVQCNTYVNHNREFWKYLIRILMFKKYGYDYRKESVQVSL